MHPYFVKCSGWLILDAAVTYAALRFTAVAIGNGAAKHALVATLCRVPVWATAFLPYEYYWSWTPWNVCVDDGTA